MGGACLLSKTLFCLLLSSHLILSFTRDPLYPVGTVLSNYWINWWVGHHLSPLLLLLSILLTGYGPWSALISFGTSLLPLLMEKDLTGLLVGLTAVSLKSWPFGVTSRPIVDRVDLSLELPHAYRIFCFIADAMAHGWLGWSTAHFLLHLLPELSWLLW